MKAGRETLLAFMTVSAVVLLASATIFFSAWPPVGGQAVFLPLPPESGDDALLEEIDPAEDEHAEDTSEEDRNSSTPTTGTDKPAEDPTDKPTEMDGQSSARLSPKLWSVFVESSVLLHVRGNAVGSGVLLGKEPTGKLLVLTVWHAAKRGVLAVDFFSLRSLDRPLVTSESVEVVSHSERRDLAILRVGVARTDVHKLNPGIQVCDQLPEQSLPEQSLQGVHSLGCEEGGAAIPIAEKIVGKFKVRLPGQPQPTLMWKTKFPQSAGRSGGGLVDSEGNLLGIALGKTESTARAGYYCHHQEIVTYLVDSGLGWLLKCGTSGK